MKLKKWDELPPEMKNDSVKAYYEILTEKKAALFFKRVFDIVVSAVMLVIFLPIFIVLAAAVKLDSKGPIFYKQIRVTAYGKRFKIIKFRTMVTDADKGALVTSGNDSRITRVGNFLRKTRLDETTQLFNIFIGDMSFVGTRPEVPRYTSRYTEPMMATLLLPAGVTSLASIYYKDEAELLDGAENTEDAYVEKILPVKMYFNLKDIEDFGFFRDIKIMIMTVLAVLGVKYRTDIPKATFGEKVAVNE